MMGEIGETSGTALEFTFGCKKEVNALKARCKSGQSYIIIEYNGAENGVRVCCCMIEQKCEEMGDKDDFFCCDRMA